MPQESLKYCAVEWAAGVQAPKWRRIEARFAAHLAQVDGPMARFQGLGGEGVAQAKGRHGGEVFGRGVEARELQVRQWRALAWWAEFVRYPLLFSAKNPSAAPATPPLLKQQPKLARAPPALACRCT